MRRLATVISVAFIGVLLLSACRQSTTKQVSTDIVNNPVTLDGVKDLDYAVIEFDYTFHDFGRVKQGQKMNFGFRFTNTGKKDLVIENVNRSCGCTVAEFPKQPIKHGKGDQIKITLNTEGYNGPITKQVTVYSNTNPAKTILTIKAVVEK